jgi:hypothetical protein
MAERRRDAPPARRLGRERPASLVSIRLGPISSARHDREPTEIDKMKRCCGRPICSDARLKAFSIQGSHCSVTRAC